MKKQEQKFLEQAAKLLGVRPSKLGHFSETDPFNGVEVRGFICLQQDHRYGALYIYYADGDLQSPQVVYGTPKLRYPFDKQGRFRFPVAERIEVYEKLDGTNILAFVYETAHGERKLSFKTRLCPFIRSDEMRNFFEMWQKILETYPRTVEWILSLNGLVSVSFEMYGSQNPHLIRYDKPLDAALLFGVIQADASVIPPSVPLLSECPIPSAPLIAKIGGEEDLVQLYRKHQAEMQARLQKVDGGYIGQEGCVWYVLSPNGRWTLFKCKPPDIEEIHWAKASGGIPEAAVRHACYRVIEDGQELNAENVALYLKEDFPEELVERYGGVIQDVVNQVLFEQKVRSAYDEIRRLGFDFTKDPKEVMRKFNELFSDRFQKREMGKVFYVLSQIAGEKNKGP